MFNIKVRDFKIFDSLQNIVNINYLISTDSNYENVLANETNNNNGNDIDLEIIKRENDPIFCKVNVIGSNGESGFVEAKEDFSRSNYIFNGFKKYPGRDILKDRIILGELIYDKDNNLLHNFSFVPEDTVLYTKELNLSLNIDFNFNILSNKVFSYPRITNTNTYIYNKQTIDIQNEKLVIDTKVRFGQLMTNFIRYDLNTNLNNKYLEMRVKLPNTDNIKSYIKLGNDIDVIDVVSKTNEIIESNVSNNNYILNNFNIDEYNIIGMFFKENKTIELYHNHKLLFVFNNLNNFVFKNLDIGNDIITNDLVESSFLVDYIRLYDVRDDYNHIAY